MKTKKYVRDKVNTDELNVAYYYEGEDPRTTKAREQYLGKEFSFNNGNTDLKMKVVEFDNYNDVTVQVGESDMYITTDMSSIKRGMVLNPFKKNSPIAFTDPKYEYLNCIFKTNEGYLIRILNCEDRNHTLYEFIDNGYQDTTEIHNIFRGQVKNPYHRNQFGGYLGPDKTYRKKEFEWLKKIWSSLLPRCIDNKEYYFKYHKNHAYDNVFIDNRWYCYGMFAQWYMYYYSQLNPNFKYEVDKDLKYPIYSQFTCKLRCYGPDTCLLIPKELNSMLQAKVIKENHDKGITGVLPDDHPLKEAARRYKSQNALLDEAYNIIMNM